MTAPTDPTAAPATSCPKAERHCYHVTGVVPDMDPPLVSERCCWCGDYRRRILVLPSPRGFNHGRYCP